jgi:hypothetical protein
MKIETIKRNDIIFWSAMAVMYVAWAVVLYLLWWR